MFIPRKLTYLYGCYFSRSQALYKSRHKHRPETRQMTYVVMAPAKTYSGVQVVPDMITDDLKAAKRQARAIRDKHTRRGWKGWANKVAIKAPCTAQGYWEMAEMVAARGHEIDTASQGNSFYAAKLLDWANTLRVRADEVANPEACTA